MNAKIYGLIGRKLGHSYSVPIHRELGSADYRLIELEPEHLAVFLSDPDIGGLNVTIPYKRDVMPYCGVLSPEAKAIGCVNTLVRRGDGVLCGYNTDVFGFEYMAKRAGISFAGRKTVIFGSGGASLTARAVVKKLGASEIVIISRSGADNYGNLDRHADAEIIVNTTPVGMYPDNGASPADVSLFPRCAGVLDVVYNPRRTALLLQAQKLGIPNTDGLPMLVAQAKAAEEYFNGDSIGDAEIERIIRTLRRGMENIVLIGMPGSGKSALGALLAGMTGRPLIDIDEQIVIAAGRPITEIFAKDGEAGFRALEREATRKAGRESGRIIVTGGGVVKDGQNYVPLRQNGRIYHVVRDLNRLDREGRPLSQGADLAQMYRERLPMYTAFRDAVIENNSALKAAAEAIWRDFCENTGD